MSAVGAAFACTWLPHVCSVASSSIPQSPPAGTCCTSTAFNSRAQAAKKCSIRASHARGSLPRGSLPVLHAWTAAFRRSTARPAKSSCARAVKQSSQQPSTCTNDASLEVETGRGIVRRGDSALTFLLPLDGPLLALAASFRSAGCEPAGFSAPLLVPPFAGGGWPSTCRVIVAVRGAAPLLTTATSTKVPGAPVSKVATCSIRRNANVTPGRHTIVATHATRANRHGMETYGSCTMSLLFNLSLAVAHGSISARTCSMVLPSTAWPATPRISSPATIPATSAGPVGRTPCTLIRQPDVMSRSQHSFMPAPPCTGGMDEQLWVVSGFSRETKMNTTKK